MSNEEGYFEIYWALHGQKTWDRTRLPSDPIKPPLNWGFGFKDAAHDAWMARAYHFAKRGEMNSHDAKLLLDVANDQVFRIRTLEAELAAAERQGTAAHEACVGYEARIAALESALQLYAAGCDNCGGQGYTIWYPYPDQKPTRKLCQRAACAALARTTAQSPPPQYSFTDSDDVPRGTAETEGKLVVNPIIKRIAEEAGYTGLIENKLLPERCSNMGHKRYNMTNCTECELHQCPECRGSGQSGTFYEDGSPRPCSECKGLDDSDDVPRGTSGTACEQVKCLHPLHHGWHDRKDDCVHPMTRREFSDYEPKTKDE